METEIFLPNLPCWHRISVFIFKAVLEINTPKNWLLRRWKRRRKRRRSRRAKKMPHVRNWYCIRRLTARTWQKLLSLCLCFFWRRRSFCLDILWWRILFNIFLPVDGQSLVKRSPSPSPKKSYNWLPLPLLYRIYVYDEWMTKKIYVYSSNMYVVLIRHCTMQKIAKILF
jgi:hypothetical protein